MRWTGILAGVLLAVLAVGALWGTSVLDTPESVGRTLAALSALYPGSLRGAVVERIPCAALKRLRLYVVCTEGCAETWMIVGVRGLWAENLANLARIPPQPPEESRERITRAVAADGRSLDPDGAREMILCYMRIQGEETSRIMDPLDLVRLEGIRESEEGMRRFADSLDGADAASRIDLRETGDGYQGRLFYWETTLEGGPVQEMTFSLERNGVLRSVDVEESLRGGSATGSTPGTPPF